MGPMKCLYLLLSAAALVGCTQDTPWESSLVCAGPETSSTMDRTSMQATSPSFTHRMSAEVRFRHGEILVRSLNAPTYKDSEGVLHFHSQYAGGWMAGQYDASRTQLNLIIERHLHVTGTEQAIRTVGTYQCAPSTGPLIKGQGPESV